MHFFLGGGKGTSKLLVLKLLTFLWIVLQIVCLSKHTRTLRTSHSELCHSVARSQDFCCEMCGTSMKTALLPLTSGSGSSQADKEAKELARQISFKV